MNLSQLIDANNDNTFYLPASLTDPQLDLCEILLKLHSSHLKKLFFANKTLLSFNNNKKTINFDTLSDYEMLNLLYSNLNSTSNNPYLLVDHYIPKKMLLMNTKFSLINISGKFEALNNIILQYESLNYRKPNKNYNVLLLADSSKELDFIESLLVGRFINYQRYTGTKLFESNAPKANPFRFPSSADSSTSLDSESNSNNSNSKDDPYLLKRLKKKHKRTMNYLKNNSFNKGYCLTMHLITIDQLKFQFFKNNITSNNKESANVNYNFLDLQNTILFNYIISFNSYLNLNQYHLKKLRNGIIDPASGKLKKIKISTPVLFLVPENSIENVSIKVHDWLIYHKLINTNIGNNSDYSSNNSKKKISNAVPVSIDERISKYECFINKNDFDSENYLMIMSLILMIYIISRNSLPKSDNVTDFKFNNIHDWWYEGDLQNLNKLYSNCQLPNNLNNEIFESLMKQFSANVLISNKKKSKKFQKNNSNNMTPMGFKEKFEKLVSLVNSTIISNHDNNLLMDKINTFKLKYPIFEAVDRSLINCVELLKQCKSIHSKYSTTLKIFNSEEYLAHLRKDFFDNSSDLTSKSFLTIDIESIEAELDNLENIALKYKQIQQDQETYAERLVNSENDKEHINVEQYKKNLTKFIKNRSRSLNSINEIFYNLKLIEENTIGNYLQIQMEKNNYFSKILFDQQLKIVKGIAKSEKFMERLYSDYLKIKNDEKLIKLKINYFNKSLLRNEISRNDVEIQENKEEDSLLEKELMEYMNKYQEEKQKIIDSLKIKEEEKQKINNSGKSNDENESDIIKEREYYFSLNHEKINFNEYTNSLSIESIPSIIQASSTSSQIKNNQLLIIKHLEKEISKLQDDNSSITDTIESSRVKYQEISSMVALQIETIKDLDTKISAIQQILKRKPIFFDLKKVAFDNNHNDAINKSTSDLPKLFNLSNFEQIRYSNYAKQKEFLENYSKLLKAANKNNINNNKRLSSSSGGSEESTPTPNGSNGSSKRNNGSKRRRGNN